MRDITATRTSGSGELYALLNATERAIPVVATAQFVVLSRRVRQILLRYISPLYRWASIPSSAALNGFFGGSATLMSLPPVRMRHEVLRGYRKGTTARKVKNHRIGVNAIPTCSSARPSPPEFCKRLNVFLGYSLEFLWTESGCRISISKNLIIEDLNALLTPSAGIRHRRLRNACRNEGALSTVSARALMVR